MRDDILSWRVKYGLRLGFLITAMTLLFPVAHAEIEEIVVTAQKREESVQDVPISVSAFDNAALEARQIDTFSDLQFNVPNVSYSKGNFSGNNFQIRGIGTLLTATSSDSGVGMHINDVYLNSPRIFETEYYDVAQLEVLRGPQGTLFGRNATGGAVNLKTARPEMDELYADIELQYGDYDHGKVKGAVNIPIADGIAGRIAGIWVNRDGYSENLVTGNDVDDRDQWSLRGSLRFEINDSTTLDLIGHTFEEDSSRSRSQKQFCNQDPSAILGCTPDGLGLEPINTFATAGTALSSTLLLGPLGVFDFFDQNLDPSFGNPRDLRDVRLTYEPEYEAEENFYMAELVSDISETLTVTAIAAFQDTEVISRQDYNGTAADPGAAVIPPAFCVVSPAACTFFGTSAGGPIPVTTVPNPNTSLGIIGGPNEFTLDTRGAGRDLSLQESEQWSTELRLASSFNGPLNFLLAGYFLDFETETDYFVQAPGLDYATIALATPGTPFQGSADQFLALSPGYFNSETDSFELESTGIFGELYYEATETLKFTLGLRWTRDEKSLRDRQLFLNLPVLVDLPSNTTSFVGSDGSITPITNITELTTAAAAVGDFDADPNVPGAQVYREDDIAFEEITGRFVVDWVPTVDFTDETLVYFSYSRGYKSGGINPPIDTNLFPNTPTSFEPEKIDAFEIGTKNTFLDRTMQANFSVFYYDYGDLQIGKIINRTSVNENTDADIFGAELELLYAPNENWQFNAAVSYLDTELGETETIDPRDPTQGRQDVTLLKDFVDASNCVVEHNGQGPLSDNAAFVATVQGAGAPYLPTGRDLGAFGGPAGQVIPTTPGVSDSAFTACAAAAAIAPLFGYNYLDSVQTNLDGNNLLNAPELTFSAGAEYTHYFDGGISATARVDYYWQDEFYSTTFNRAQDLIDSWDVWNAQFTVYGKDQQWYAKFFVQNIEDDDEIVGTYQTDPSSGLFTNAFFIEPRLYGLTVGVSLN